MFSNRLSSRRDLNMYKLIMAFFISFLTISCGKNKTRGDITRINLLKTKNELEKKETYLHLRDQKLTLNLDKKHSEIKLKISPSVVIKPYYKKSYFYLPVHEYTKGPNMSYLKPREDIRCSVTRFTYDYHISEDISHHILDENDFSFIFNGKKVSPTIIERTPLTFFFDLRTIKKERTLVVINKTVKNDLRFKDDKKECDWVLKNNKKLSIFPKYIAPKETLKRTSHKVFKVVVSK